MVQRKIRINMVMEGKLAQRLDYLKDHYQVENYTDLIRFLISQAHEKIKRESIVGEDVTK